MNKILPSLSLGLLMLGLPLAGLAQTILPEPTAASNPPVPPTAEAAKAQHTVVSHVRRLVRDVQDNLDNIKSKGNFGAQLWLVGSETFFQDWRKPETPTIDPVSLVGRGSGVYTAVIFYGAARDDKGLSNVSYDMTVRKPDGSVYNERKSMIGFQNLAIDERELQLGRNYLSIVLTPEDPVGTYTVDAVVHDNVARTDLNLKQTFVVQ